MAKVGIRPPFTLVSSIVLGYPRFKQEGLVAREFRPITWHREGSDNPDIEAFPSVPEYTGKRVRTTPK
jgi:hypothetical protein